MPENRKRPQRQPRKTANSTVRPDRRVTLSVPIPERTTLSGATAFTGSSALATGIVSGHAPTEPVHIIALVALVIATMAYDIARKTLHMRHRT
ncbi:hypothetical protein [Streptomyces sp. NPDC001381]|uniref:hypothetical protein n=1 Tax=Streptomyces sp. NPDC001381 TaxID=3364567 RepID=UPI0036798BE0